MADNDRNPDFWHDFKEWDYTYIWGDFDDARVSPGEVREIGVLIALPNRWIAMNHDNEVEVFQSKQEAAAFAVTGEGDE